MRIGLLGGSFDPAHAGHRAASLKALRRLGLDRVWWLVSPGNPLKDAPSGGLPARIANARRIAAHPRIAVTGIEAELGTRYTVDTLRWLVRRLPGVSFVWLMGADNLAGFDRWRDWEQIAAMVPIAILDRPGLGTAPLATRSARRMQRARRPERLAKTLPGTRPPAWIFLAGPRINLSSTMLRRDERRASS